MYSRISKCEIKLYFIILRKIHYTTYRKFDVKIHFRFKIEERNFILKIKFSWKYNENK